MSNKVLISGANRGLGFGFVRRSLDNGYFVFAGCRNPDQAIDLKELKKKISREAIHY